MQKKKNQIANCSRLFEWRVCCCLDCDDEREGAKSFGYPNSFPLANERKKYSKKCV